MQQKFEALRCFGLAKPFNLPLSTDSNTLLFLKWHSIVLVPLNRSIYFTPTMGQKGSYKVAGNDCCPLSLLPLLLPLPAFSPSWSLRLTIWLHVPYPLLLLLFSPHFLFLPSFSSSPPLTRLLSPSFRYFPLHSQQLPPHFLYKNNKTWTNTPIYLKITSPCPTPSVPPPKTTVKCSLIGDQHFSP